MAKTVSNANLKATVAQVWKSKAKTTARPFSKSQSCAKTSPLRPHKSANPLSNATASVRSKPKVALFSSNGTLMQRLDGNPFARCYRLDMFTTSQGYKFVDRDVIILDDGIVEFSVESYMTRHAARLDLSRRIQNDRSTNHQKVFKDFAKVYEECNFVRYAETTELLVNIANDQLLTWRNYLHNEGGFAPIRVKQQWTNKTVAKPCILLPSTALANWKESFNEITTRLVGKYLREWDPRVYNNPEELKKLFYVKRIGIDNPDRDKFLDVPVWKMDIMLKKWRTDRALERWGDVFRVRSGSDKPMTLV